MSIELFNEDANSGEANCQTPSPARQRIQLSEEDIKSLYAGREVRQKIEGYQPRRTLAELFHVFDLLVARIKNLSPEDVEQSQRIVTKYFPDFPEFDATTKDEFRLMTDTMAPIDLRLLCAGILILAIKTFGVAVDLVPKSERQGFIIVDRMILVDFWFERLIDVERMRPGIVSKADAISDLLAEIVPKNRL